MNCNVMTEGRWLRLLDGRLSADEAASLQAHLATDCPACERFFEAMDETTEKRLRGLFQGGFQDVMRRVEQRRSTRWSFPIPVWSAAAVLLMVGAAAVLYWDTGRPPVQNEKGRAVVAPDFRLEFAVGDQPADGSLTVHRGVLGGRYRSSAEVFLRVETDEPGHLYLLGYSAGGPARSLFEGRIEGPIARPIRTLPLEGMSGRQVIVGVYSAGPLNIQSQVIPSLRNSVDTATGAVRPESFGLSKDGVAMDAVYFDVEG
jgi:hypothetical protein